MHCPSDRLRAGLKVSIDPTDRIKETPRAMSLVQIETGSVRVGVSATRKVALFVKVPADIFCVGATQADAWSAA
jgi:hypothetical protein